jgi:hypothetical protein
MKAVVLSAVIGTILAAGLVQSRAQTNTNVTIGVTIALSGMAQTGANTAKTVRITTRDVINAAGTFSTRARLLAVFPDNGNLHFIVRDGTTDVAAPITVTSVRSVDVTKTTTSGAMTGSSASILSFVFDGAGHPSFDVQGYTTVSESNRGNGHDLLHDNAPVGFRSSVNGTGADASADPAVLQGTISGSGRKVEIF